MLGPTRRRVNNTNESLNSPNQIQKDCERRKLTFLGHADDETDSELDDPNFLRNARKHVKIRKQGGTLIILMLCISLFVYGINWYNSKQLERLKEEYGMEIKRQEATEGWWDHSLIYRIYPRSFFDSNGDGIGDLNGISSKISYLSSLNIQAVILDRIHESALLDLGNDVFNFTNVEPILGSMQDFENLISIFHKNNIKVVLEFIPNHTSDRHFWFKESRKGGAVNPFRDYYIWSDGKIMSDGSRSPPNNWISKYGGSAWTWDKQRQQYYYHYYHTGMPDLNHRTPDVRQSIWKVFEFWLDKGIDGVSIKGSHIFFESQETFLDEPVDEKTGYDLRNHECLDHVYTEFQPEIHESLATWRELFDEYSLHHSRKILLLVDAVDHGIGDIIKYYETGADAPYNYRLAGLDEGCNGHCVHELIDMWLASLPDGRTSFWTLSSPVHGRIASRNGPKNARVLNMLAMLLPGATVSYYGDEIGMQNAPLTFEEIQDLGGKHAGRSSFQKVSHNPSETPMQWSNSNNAGFTSNKKSWLPVHPQYTTCNTQTQLSNMDGSSSLQVYQILSRLRREPSFLHGRIQNSIISQDIYSFIRFALNHPPYLVAANVGLRPVTENFATTTGMNSGRLMLYIESDDGRKARAAINSLDKNNRDQLDVHMDQDGASRNAHILDLDTASMHVSDNKDSNSAQFQLNEPIKKRINLESVVLYPGEGVVIQLF